MPVEITRAGGSSSDVGATGRPPDTATVHESLHRWSQLVTETWTNETLKQQLLSNPVSVLQEHGINVRPGLDIRIMESSDKVAYLTLPGRPAAGELTTDQLNGIVGGASLVEYGMLVGLIAVICIGAVG